MPLVEAPFGSLEARQKLISISAAMDCHTAGVFVLSLFNRLQSLFRLLMSAMIFASETSGDEPLHSTCTTIGMVYKVELVVPVESFFLSIWSIRLAMSS